MATTYTQSALQMAQGLYAELGDAVNDFSYDESMKFSFEKKYKYVDDAILASRYSNDAACMTSDIFVMYAVAMLQCASIYQIMQFLDYMIKDNKALVIPNLTDIDVIKQIVKRLVENGLLFRVNYRTANERHSARALYSVIDEKYSYIESILQREIRPVVRKIYFSPLSVVLSQHANSETALAVKGLQNDFSFNRKIYVSKYLGRFSVPVELVRKKNGIHINVAFIPSYCMNDTSILTPKDFEALCLAKINLAKNYMALRRNDTNASFAVFTVEGTEDLDALCGYISRCGIIKDYVDSVYFVNQSFLTVGQGPLMLQMQLDGKSGGTYSYVAVKPSFID